MKKIPFIQKKLNTYLNISLFKLFLQVVAFFITASLYQNCERNSQMQTENPDMAVDTQISLIKPKVENY